MTSSAVVRQLFRVCNVVGYRWAPCRRWPGAGSLGGTDDVGDRAQPRRASGSPMTARLGGRRSICHSQPEVHQYGYRIDPTKVPTDASIIGIVDSVELQGKMVYRKDEPVKNG